MIDDAAGVAEVERMISRTGRALESCWDEADGFYYSRDTRTGQAIRQPGIGGLLTLYADPTAAKRHPALIDRLRHWLDRVAFGVPSFDPDRPEFEPRRYWRGPVWLVVNWMLIDGLKRNGHQALSRRIRRDSMSVVARSGFREYFDPTTGEGLGGTDFSWTAAMMLLFAGLKGRPW
jgi:neutral trehalase